MDNSIPVKSNNVSSILKMTGELITAQKNIQLFLVFLISNVHLVKVPGLVMLLLVLLPII